MAEVQEDPYFRDPGFMEIARGSYSEEELKDMGCLKCGKGQSYILLSKNQLGGIDLVFERNSDGLWVTTYDNKVRLFRLKDERTRTLEEIDEEMYFYQRFENKRRREGRGLSSPLDALSL